MSKVLTDLEVLEIIESAVKWDEIDCADQYKHFLEDLGKLMSDHFGGEFECVSEPLMEEGTLEEIRFCLHFGWNKYVPEGGGVYAKYDIEEWGQEAL